MFATLRYRYIFLFWNHPKMVTPFNICFSKHPFLSKQRCLSKQRYKFGNPKVFVLFNNSVCQNNSVWILLALSPIYGQQPQTEDLKPVVAPRIRDATGNPRNRLPKVPGRFSPSQSGAPPARHARPSQIRPLQTEDLKPVVAPRIRHATGNPRNQLPKVPGRFSPSQQSPEKDKDKMFIHKMFKHLQSGVRVVQMNW